MEQALLLEVLALLSYPCVRAPQAPQVCCRDTRDSSPEERWNRRFTTTRVISHRTKLKQNAIKGTRDARFGRED